MFDREIWARVPFHFWSVVFFWFGSMVGSFLNVCIYRMPRGESIIFPPSHCPNCKYRIPWYLNIPLVTWLYLRAKCRNCGAPISPRYFLVELLTATLFLGCWLTYGQYSVGATLVFCLMVSGFVVATFIDFEHLIIPDEITIGGIVAGLLCSFFVPELHLTRNSGVAMQRSFLGVLVGGGVIYAILWIGKLAFGRNRMELAPDSTVIFTETTVKLPSEEIPYDDLFYRNSDAVVFDAKKIELIDRCYSNVHVRLQPKVLTIGDEKFNPEDVPYIEAVLDKIVLPREAMGFGDVKFMAAIGAFLGWIGVLFSLLVSSVIGAAVGVSLIVSGKREWSSRIPYGPYIAIAATLWLFFGGFVMNWILGPMR